MSDNGPGPEPGQPEYLGPGGPASGANGPADADGAGGAGGVRHTGLVALASIAVVLALGAGAYAMVQLLGGGHSPASAVPADAIGYVSVDLDPSASQKIEAIKILRQFPALKDELKMSSRDDVRRRLFEEIRKDGSCKSLDYDDDIKPWIGERLGVAAVPQADHKITPLVTIQVSDQDRAKSAAKKLEACASSSDDSGSSAGVAFSGDYMLVTDTQDHADAMAKSADSAALADDNDFKTWVGRAGDPGIITMYAAPDAGKVMSEAAKARRRDSGTTFAPQEDPMEKVLKDFGGAAGVIRFKDGAVDAEVVSKGLPGGLPTSSATSGGADVDTLPASTAAVLSVSLPPGWLDHFVRQLKDTLGEASYDRALQEAQQQTGLTLPDDLETLLGDGFTISADSGADLSKLKESPDPADVPAGLRIKGDADKIKPIVDKLKGAAGPEGDKIVVDSLGDLVALGTDPDYVSKLLEKGDLGSQESFDDAVPEAKQASSILYVNFDAGNGWAGQLADLLSGGDSDVKANIEPLDALGISAWVDEDKVQHGLLRLTTD
jgi:hypothetical protein